MIKLESKKERGAVVITVQGDLDTISSAEFEKHLNGWLSKRELFFVFDFSGVEYVSSSGLRVLVAASKLLKPKDGKISFVGVHGHVLEVFKMSYFLLLFGMFDRVEDAISQTGAATILDHLQLYGGLEGQKKIVDFIASHAKATGFDPMRIKDIRLVAEEILTSIYERAYLKEKGEYEVSCKIWGDKFVIELSDSGMYFDIHAQEGMWATLIQKMISHIEFRRVNNRNVHKLILPMPGK